MIDIYCRLINKSDSLFVDYVTNFHRVARFSDVRVFKIAFFSRWDLTGCLATQISRRGLSVFTVYTGFVSGFVFLCV